MTDRPTLDSVARSARVSRQTVSNVLNAPHLVRPDTLARVRAAIDAAGYRPHQAARVLRTRRSHLIAVRLQPFGDGTSGFVLDRFLHRLTEAAQDAGYRILLFTAVDDDAEIAGYDELLTAHDLDAFVLTGTHRDDARTAWLAGRRAVFATFGRPWGGEAAHSWVDVDGGAGTASATAHLLGGGHTRIGFIGWPAGSDVGDDRRDGWRRTLAAAGHDPAGLDRDGWDGVAQGRAAAADLLASGRPPTALVCASDSLALGALAEAEALAAGGHTGKVAVTGFDDTPAAAAVGLTSVAQPLAEVANRLLADLLTRLGTKDPPPARHQLLAPRLVVRTSG